MTDKRPNHFKIVYQTDFKEAKENSKITKGAKKSKGMIKKLQIRKRKTCKPVKLPKQLTFHNNKERGKANKSKCKTEKNPVKKNAFRKKIFLRLVGISVDKKNRSVPSV